MAWTQTPATSIHGQTTTKKKKKRLVDSHNRVTATRTDQENRYPASQTANSPLPIL